ncbi:MAG: DUF3256 family protein [Bacteroidaceae bacterium]|nr:DUF3256 family protein [Bacteroidaceae bacterium]
MKKISIVLCILCFLCEITHAQSLKDLFLKMPQEVCPVLSEYNRLEIVDNQKNGKTMQTRNLFRTFSKMEELTDDYAHLVISKNSEKEMKMLTKNDGTRIIMVISTIFCDETPDSSVAFYSTDWKPLPTHDYYTLPPIDNFRRVTIDNNTDQLVVSTTNAPLMLNIDGSNQPKEPYTLTNTFHWSTEENRFILDN